MDASGGSLPTTVKKSVHHPTMVCCSRREAGRSNYVPVSVARQSLASSISYVDGVLVDLQHGAEDLSSLQACLAGQRVANVQQLREGHGDNLVKVCPVLSRLEPVDLADGQQTLHTGKDGRDISGIQQLDGDVEKVGPF